MSLPTSDWKRALSLFDEALSLPPDARDAWLAHTIAREPAVSPLLQKLLGAHRRVETNDILATLPRRSDALRGVPAGTQGEHIGPFELIEPIGEGGMGSVWRARYADGRLKRDVAIKLPAATQDPTALATMRERFARERDFLAQLEHPNIARLYDTGVSETGQPFLAMEYVAGEPIDAYCDKHRLTIKARLTLYLQVLDAVEFAHRQLVLHRDLKPGNVLVDGPGHARLLDFGVAKLLPGTGATTNTDLSIAKGTDLTEMAGAAITLAYAAPEQINNGRLSTATDVYALGVMLYRLLTGSAPYQPKRDTRGALEDEVLTTDPGNASTRFASSETLAARQTTEVALRRALAGDIDTILAKALKKNPDDRYPTVEAFAKDIERALNGQPVLAQPDSAWYRTRKFVQRHPWAVAVSSAGAVTLMVAAGVAVWQGGEARTQAALAEREASRAKAVQQFLVTLFQSANPEKSRGKTLTVREVLDQGAQRIRTEFANQPETEAALAGEIGVIYESLGDLDKAVTFLGRKVALLDSVRKSGTADFVDANERLGRYLVNAERYAEAEAPLARALAEAARIEPAARERRLHASMTLGLLRLRTGKIIEAQTMLTAVHDEIATMPNVTPKLAWLADMHLGEAAFTGGSYSASYRLYALAVERIKEDPAAETVDLLHAELNLAENDLNLRHLEEAEIRFQSLVARSTELLGPHASDTQDARTGLARTVAAKGDYARAKILQNDVLTVAQRNGNFGEIATAQMFQIRNEIGTGQLASARQLVDSALNYYAALHAGVDRTTERLRVLLAEVQCASKAIGDAEHNARTALLNQEAMLPETSPQIAQTLDVLGSILRAQSRYEEAITMHKRSLNLHVTAFGISHVRALRSAVYLSMAKIGSGMSNGTIEFTEARGALSHALGPNHPAQKQLRQATAWSLIAPIQRRADGTSEPGCFIDF